MLLTRNRLIGWAIANIGLALGYLFFASWTWLDPVLRDEDVARGGDAFAWMLGAFPVLLVAGLLNAVWFFAARKEQARRNARWPIAVIAIITVAWIGAIAIDWCRGRGLF
jgi:hypothetical protein